AVTENPQAHQVLFASRRILADRRALILRHRPTEHRERLLSTLPRADVVGTLEVDGIDRADRYELADVDRLRQLLFARLELFRREGDVAAFRELVSFDEIFPRYDLVVFGAVVLLLHARTA